MVKIVDDALCERIRRQRALVGSSLSESSFSDFVWRDDDDDDDDDERRRRR